LLSKASISSWTPGNEPSRRDNLHLHASDWSWRRHYGIVEWAVGTIC